MTTAGIPPPADPGSRQTAGGFSLRGGQHAAAVAQGTEELGRSGAGVAESGAGYAALDAAAAASYHGVWG
jgi:hypothetical protein